MGFGICKSFKGIISIMNNREQENTRVKLDLSRVPRPKPPLVKPDIQKAVQNMGGRQLESLDALWNIGQFLLSPLLWLKERPVLLIKSCFKILARFGQLLSVCQGRFVSRSKRVLTHNPLGRMKRLVRAGYKRIVKVVRAILGNCLKPLRFGRRFRLRLVDTDAYEVKAKPTPADTRSIDDLERFLS